LAAADRRLGYVRGLDGIRAVAVLAVMCFHAGVPRAIGGFIGVDVFFVLSGFLITSLLHDEWQRSGTIAIGAFYVRRALRLFPALFVLLAALQLYSLTFYFPEQVTRLRIESLATLFYVANWAYALEIVPQLGFLSHAWSLGIEEQFYLLWPLALRAMLARLDRRQILGVLCAAIAASALWRAGLWAAGSPFPRVFFGFDTRLDVILSGCAAALALAWHAPSARVRLMLDRAAILGAAVLVVASTRISWLASYMYFGGFTAIALAAVSVISSIRESPDGVLARVLSWGPLVAIGRISYALYLWHWPVFLACRTEGLELGEGALLALQFALTFALATASFFLVERPFLRLKARLHDP
jgi:peptidoglycan/LPS O-acetylase OafA/YrhL